MSSSSKFDVALPRLRTTFKSYPIDYLLLMPGRSFRVIDFGLASMPDRSQQKKFFLGVMLDFMRFIIHLARLEWDQLVTITSRLAAGSLWDI